MPIDRRQLLSGRAGLLGLAWLAPARRALALGADAEVGVALLAHGGGAEARPQAVEQLMWEASKRTSIDVRERPVLVGLDDADLFRHPLLVWIGLGDVPPLGEAARTRLGRYLRSGGSLFIDDASPEGDEAFDAAVRREMKAIWPDRPLARLSNDHTLYRSFFLLERPFGRIDREPHLWGMDFDDRSPVVYGRNDLFGAFGRDSLGNWLLPVYPGGAAQREMAFRLGINVLMYATCLNYKRDQVHTTAILRRRRWKVDQARETR